MKAQARSFPALEPHFQKKPHYEAQLSSCPPSLLFAGDFHRSNRNNFYEEFP
jgi:hypothetical protein